MEVQKYRKEESKDEENSKKDDSIILKPCYVS